MIGGDSGPALGRWRNVTKLLVNPIAEKASATMTSDVTVKAGEVARKIIGSVALRSTMWVDEEFHADDSVLPNNLKKNVRWLRTSEISERPQLFVGGASAGDVQQGALGDCWFLGALSVVATRKDLLRKIFLRFDPNGGFFQCTFFKQGRWRLVTCDDLLPCDAETGNLLFAHGADREEMWVPLIEKAYAKIHGSYSKLIGGLASEALEDLTGGNEEKMDFDDVDVKELIKTGKFWEHLLIFKTEGFMLGCARLCRADAKECDDTGMGILGGHAYGILDLMQVSTGDKLIKIRNPWGMKEWVGDWSDSSLKWTPSLESEVNLVHENDGTFWMCYDDFVKYFDKMYVARLYFDDVGEKWTQLVLNGEWSVAAGTAGGCLKWNTWFQNPQYVVVSPASDSKAFISLNQPDRRMNDTRENVHCGFYLLKHDIEYAKKRTIVSLEAELVGESRSFTDARGRSLEVMLEKGQQYVIIPTTFAPKKETQFILSVWVQHPEVKVTPLKDRVVGRVEEFTFVGHREKSVFRVEIEEEGECVVEVECLPKVSSLVPGVIITKRDVPQSIIMSEGFISNEKHVLAKSCFVKGERRSAVLVNFDEPGFYYIVPTAFSPRKKRLEQKMSLKLMSPGADLSVIQMPAFQHPLVIHGEWNIGRNAAGGSPNNQDSWLNNPRYCVEFKKVDDVLLGLSLRNDGNGKTPLGFVLCKDDSSGGTGKLLRRNIVKSVFSSGKAMLVLARGDLENGKYLLIPSTFEPGVETAFELSVNMSKDSIVALG